jgi:colanic acid biosynthesis glycosyl transferase WcaI
MKHNPGLLLALARHFQAHADVQVVVVSEGIGADWLRAQVQAGQLANLAVFDFEPIERYAEVLASGDVLISILQPEAGIYSVPSKVLSYFCARRPLLLAIPEANLAARVVREIDAGLVVPPAEPASFLEAASRLYTDENLRSTQAARGRRYAEQHFDVQSITKKFETIIEGIEVQS